MHAHVAAVARSLRTRDVTALMTLFPAAGEIERRMATLAIGSVATTDDARMTDAQRRRWIEVLAQAARDEFPRTLAGRAAYGQLQFFDPRLAEEVVVERPSSRKLDDRQREWLVRALMSYVSAGAVTRLREQMKQGGEPGKIARSVLEARGLLGMRSIQALAARWRKTRAPEDLHSLYGRYVANQVGKATLASLLKLLGRPNRREGRRAWYMPNRNTALFIEADENGVLEATKFT